MPFITDAKPSEIQAVFISDLHLSAYTQNLNQAFFALITELNHLPNLQALYILGDWLDAWIGDDAYLNLDSINRKNHWLSCLLENLAKLSARGIQIFIMQGNRDFTIRQSLCDTFGGVLLSEPYFLESRLGVIRLEHGDALCTDDINYQKYRKIIRNRFVGHLLLSLPLSFRQHLAKNIQRQSKKDKKTKESSIMDVNSSAVYHALADCDILIHGHTHRPNAHFEHKKVRLVLGDWREHQNKVTAKIAIYKNQADNDSICLIDFIYPIQNNESSS